MKPNEIITKKIIEQLEKGVIPWVRPWAQKHKPINAVTKTCYHGVNFFLLSFTPYAQNCFLTFNQAKNAGGVVKSGEHGYPVVFWTLRSVDSINKKGEVEEKEIPYMRYYTVFNIEQCELPEKFKELLPKQTEFNPIEKAESIVSGYKDKPKIINEEHRAFYEVKKDYINMPKRELFTDNNGYYQTLFHELTHSTGHANRLNRNLPENINRNSDGYSFEELIAELGSAFLCAESGINTTVENSARYIKGWLEVLKNDNNFIIKASSKAQKAYDYIVPAN